MAAQYFYLDPDGQSVRGPFGLQDVWAMQDRGLLGPQSMICQGGAEDWKPLQAYSELRLPSKASSSSVARPREYTRAQVYPALIGSSVIVFAIAYFYINAHNRAMNAAPSESVQTSSASSWDDGYNQGVPAGKAWGTAGRGVPTADVMRSAAIQAVRERVHPPDEDQWVRGFESGFEIGYKEATKPAFQ